MIVFVTFSLSFCHSERSEVAVFSKASSNSGLSMKLVALAIAEALSISLFEA